MAIVTFYEKTGCKGNARQKALLAAAGHTVQAKNLKTENWSRARLYAFLGHLPVSEWFNRSAPSIKGGLLVPELLSEDDALTMLITNPLLIRRPLMEVGNERRVGFDAAEIDAWIGLSGASIPEGSLEGCLNGVAGHGKCDCRDTTFCPDPATIAAAQAQSNEPQGKHCGGGHGCCGSH